MADLRLALAQVNPRVGDISGNAARVKNWVHQAANEGAELVAFPEMVIPGYPVEDLALRSSFVTASQQAVESLARELANEGLGEITVVLGYLGRAPSGGPTNSAAVLAGGSVIARYAKHHLPSYGVFDEFRVFTPGMEPCVFEVAGKSIGLAICEDLWQESGPLSALADIEVDLLLVINGSPFEQGKTDTRRSLATHRARLLNTTVAYVNLVGGQDDLVFDGGSFVTDRSGHYLARTAQFEERLLHTDIAENGAVAPGCESVPPLGHTEETYGAIVLGLRDYVQKNGFQSVALGLSGGIDSALVAAIAADAIGGRNVIGVSMPSRYSSAHSKDDAADLAARIGADYRVAPISSKVDAFLDSTPLTGIAEENLQARMRGMTLMGLSNQEGHLVLATGNKTELAVGYSTVYGDAVGGFAPLKDVLKTDVWELARWCNDAASEKGATEPIPASSITKPPSAELRPGQLDTDSLPDYEKLDEVLSLYIGADVDREQLIAAGCDPDAIDRALHLFDKAEWKRRQYPLGPKVTASAFGRDRRLPVTNAWQEP